MSFETENADGTAVNKWNWYRNEAFIQSIWKDKFAFGLGLSHDNFLLQKLLPMMKNSGIISTLSCL